MIHPPYHAYPTPQTAHGYPNETLKTRLEGVSFTYLKTPRAQSHISIPYKLTIWIYAVRKFQTPHSLFYQGFLISFMLRLCLKDLILSF